MNRLQLVPEQKTHKQAQIREAELLKLFPLPRYFQIHFQHTHENADELKSELAEVKHTVQQINAKLDLLLELLTQAHI